MLFGVGRVVSWKSALVSVLTVRFRLTVLTIGRAGAGGPAAMKKLPPLLTSVSLVKFPYERHSFRKKAVFCGLFLKQTFPLIGFNSAGMMMSGVGAPGTFANSRVAISVLSVPPVGGFVGNLKMPVSLPAASK